MSVRPAVCAAKECPLESGHGRPEGLLHGDTTASRAVEQLKTIATARPPVTGTGRGVSNREGDTNISASRHSAWNRFLLHCHPVSGTPVGSNTETDDDCRRRQFSIGKLSVRKLPFQSNNSRRECRIWLRQGAENARKGCKQGSEKYFLGL